MKTQINNLRDYAELAWASYFYFDLKGYILQENETIITLSELVSLSYNGKIAGKKEKVGQEYSFIGKGELNGEFGELQARNFSQRYEIKFHQPNTLSGFSATLFYDKQKDEFVVGFRGTEVTKINDLVQDFILSLNGNLQSSPLLEFLEQVDKIIKNENKSIIFVGHSLGGYLAQMALIYCDIKYKDKLSFSPNEIYTFNAPSIHGWNVPSIAINPNTIKIMQDLLGKYTIDVSEKITHIYDNGGVEIIALAQYGANNALGIYTGKNDHSIKPLVNTLYFYSYLLELDANYNKVKDKSFSECIEYLNHFMKNIQIYTETFVLKKMILIIKILLVKMDLLGFLEAPQKKSIILNTFFH